MTTSPRELVERWRAGDQDAATDLYQHFFQQLSLLVSNHLAARYGAQVDSEDVLQSTFRTVFRRTQDGQFQFDADADVWKLLVTVALNKVRNRVRYLRAEKRDVRRDVALGDQSRVDDDLMQRLCEGPTVADAVEFAELMENVLRFLSTGHRTLLQMRLEGYRQDEIAERLGVDPRTVRRKLREIRDAVTQLLSGEP